MDERDGMGGVSSFSKADELLRLVLDEPMSHLRHIKVINLFPLCLLNDSSSDSLKLCPA